jgi:hypothetical protein
MSKNILQHVPAAMPENQWARTVTRKRHGASKTPEQVLEESIARIIPEHRPLVLADYMENHGRELRLDRKTYADLAESGWTKKEVNRTISTMVVYTEAETSWEDGVIIFHLLSEAGGVSADAVDAI